MIIRWIIGMFEERHEHRLNNNYKDGRRRKVIKVDLPEYTLYVSNLLGFNHKKGENETNEKKFNC